MEYEGYKIKPAKAMPSLYEILFDGKGKVAKALEGLYTSKGAAILAIDKYLKLGSHAKAATESGS